MRKTLFIAVPSPLLGGIHSVKETICINEWTLSFVIFVAFCLGWAFVRVMDRILRR